MMIGSSMFLLIACDGDAVILGNQQNGHFLLWEFIGKFQGCIFVDFLQWTTFRQWWLCRW